MGPVLKYLNEQKMNIADFKVTPRDLCEVAALIDSGTISNTIARELLAILADTGGPPEEVGRLRGLFQVSDSQAVEQIVAAVLDAHPKQVAEYKSGKQAVVGFLIGQVMRKTGGRTNPKVVREVLTKKLDE